MFKYNETVPKSHADAVRRSNCKDLIKNNKIHIMKTVLSTVVSSVSIAVKTVALFLLFFVMNILNLIPYCRSYIRRQFKALSTLQNDEEFEDSLLSWTMLTTIVKHLSVDDFKIARLGKKAPNTTTYTLDGKKSALLDFSKPGRPFVVNFGSCS